MTTLAAFLAAVLAAQGATAPPPAVAELLRQFQALAPAALSAERGREAWFRDADGRSCTSCHTDSLLTPGRHERTGKVIEPMAPSVNPERLTRVKKINKWLLRNCKWTYGRECTAQEKATYCFG